MARPIKPANDPEGDSPATESVSGPDTPAVKTDPVPAVSDPKLDKAEKDLAKAVEKAGKLEAEIVKLKEVDTKRAKLKEKADRLGEERLKPAGVKAVLPEDLVEGDAAVVIPCPLCGSFDLLVVPIEDEG